MNVLIVEDETAAYENLVDILMEVAPDIQIAGNTESVTRLSTGFSRTRLRVDILWIYTCPTVRPSISFDKIELETPIVFHDGLRPVCDRSL